MNRFLFSICLMFISFYTYSQNFTGRIIDKDGSPISRVFVINTTKLSADETNKDGSFCISAEYGDTLLIDYSRSYSYMKCVYTEKMQDIVYNSSGLSHGFPQINDEVLNQINTLYLSERYKECVYCCNYYIGARAYQILLDRHPYRNWRKNQMFFDKSKAEDMVVLLYLACISTFKYTLSNKYVFERLQWSKACVALIDDYLHENTPDNSWTAEMIHKYITFGKWGKNAIACGQHFLTSYERKRWVRQESNWYDKKWGRISDALYMNTVNKQMIFSDYPLIRYEIGTICFNHALEKGDYSIYQDYILKRIDATKDLILKCNNKNFILESIEIYEALQSINSALCSSVIEKDLCDKIGNNFERFCMEELIKLQDISYFLNGSSRYSISTDYSLRDIQDKLEDDDCAILHFEAPISSGHYYSLYDLSTRFRNYALIITKNQVQPNVWHRGYINDSMVNDLEKIKEEYPNVKRFYFVGTSRMNAYIDIAGNDSSIVRLHSLSQLLEKKDEKITGKEITFIGDINYGRVVETSFESKEKGKGRDKKYGELRGSLEELKEIKLLFDNVRPICGNSATKNVVTSEISRNKGIVHISTHGDILDTTEETDIEELILKKNVLKNSRLILSGYNDASNSSLSYLSGNDVLNIKEIDSSVVFLDACLSGRGSVGAVGAVSLAEAFHLIGAKNVICYLESVEDDVATDFSNRFYLELSKGKSCHEAFFIAKKSINQDVKVVLWE